MRIETATFLRSAATAEAAMKDKRPQVAIVGRSNVGKSSLINSLLGRNVSRTSGTPGRTRLVNLFLVNDAWILADLPGYGYAAAGRGETSKFQRLIFDYLDVPGRLILVLLVVDGRHPPMEIDRLMAESLKERDIPFAIVANKTDALSRNEAAKRLGEFRRAFAGTTVLPHSAERGDGRSDILRVIAGALDRSSE